MREVIFGLLLVVMSSAASAETYQCDYAKADIANGTMGNMSAPQLAKVEVTGDAIKTYRPDGSFIFSPPVTQSQGALKILDDGSKVYAIANDRSSFAVSDRISKVTEQWDKCVIKADENNEKLSPDTKMQMKRISEIPWDGAEANKFFLKETHLFMLLKCGWAGSVGFSTGRKPLVMLGDSYYPGEKSVFKNGEYSITFNGGSMSVAYNPQKVSGYISGVHSFTPCAAVRLGDD